MFSSRAVPHRPPVPSASTAPHVQGRPLGVQPSLLRSGEGGSASRPAAQARCFSLKSHTPWACGRSPREPSNNFVFHVACASITPLFPSPLPAARWARVWPPPGGRSELLTDGVFQNDIPTRLILFQAPWVERERWIVGGEEPQRRRSAWILPPLEFRRHFFSPFKK